MQTSFEGDSVYQHVAQHLLMAVVVIGGAATLHACSGAEPDAAQPETPNPAPVSSSPDGAPLVCPTVDDLGGRASEYSSPLDELAPIAGVWRGQVTQRIDYYGYRQTLAELPVGAVTLSVDAEGGASIAFAAGAVDAGAPPPPSSADACLGPPGCDNFDVGPEPSRIDLAECRVAEGDGATPVACDWLAAVSDAPCACAEGDCVAQGRVLTFVFSLDDAGQSLQGTVLGVEGTTVPTFELQRVP